MVDPVTRRRFGFRALFVGLSVLVVFVQILPFQMGNSRWPGPDLVVLLALAWVLRRPEYVTAPLVAAVILFGDVMFMRPLGLWAGIVVLGVEFLRTRGTLSRDLPFLVEWLTVAAVLILMTLARVLILALFLVEQPVLGLIFLQMIVSILTYPLVVAISRFVLGVRPMTPNEGNAMGHRI